MRKLLALFLAMALLSGVGITLFKRSPARQDAPTARQIPTREGRDKTQLFWQRYREATDDRVARRLGPAVDAYMRALELNPRHEDALYYVGNMNFELGEFAAAEAAWRRLVQVNPSSARAHSRLGDLYSCAEAQQLLDLDAATVAFQRAFEINKEETGPLLRLGELALTTGDLSAAREYLDAVTASNDQSVEANLLRGYLTWKAGDVEKAAELFATAVRHAAPVEPAGRVPGEGDTKAGAAPMTVEQRRCPGVRALTEDLLGSDQMVPSRDMRRWYTRLGSYLEQAK